MALVARLSGYSVGVAEDLRPGAKVEDIVVERFSAIAGLVLDSVHRRPIRKFTVNVVNLETRKQSRKMFRQRDPRIGSEGSLRIQDPHGRFFYDGLRPGAYEVTIQSDHHVFSTAEITLGAAEERNVELLLDAGGSISVRVVLDSSSEPVGSAMIQAAYQGRGLLFLGSRNEVFTDTEGRCVLVGLRNGEYSVFASHPFAQRGASAEATIADGGSVEVILWCAPAGRIEGRIGGLAGRRESGARTNQRIECVPRGPKTGVSKGGQSESERFSPSIHLRPDGTFHQDSLRPGIYRLTLVSQVFKDGKYTATGPSTGHGAMEPVGQPKRRQLGEVTVEIGKTSTIELETPAE